MPTRDIVMASAGISTAPAINPYMLAASDVSVNPLRDVMNIGVSGSSVKVATNGTTLVAVVSGGNPVTCAYSTDGVTWTKSTSFSSIIGYNSFSAITYNSTMGKFVVAGYASVTSPDGVTWTLAANNNLPATIAYSTLSNIGSTSGSTIVGFTFSSSGAWSSDGQVWTALPVIAANLYVQAVGYGPSAVLLVTSDGVMYSSPNGLGSWTVVANFATVKPAGSYPESIISTGTTSWLIILAGVQNTCSMTSTDGNTWVVNTVSSTYNVSNNLAYLGTGSNISTHIAGDRGTLRLSHYTSNGGTVWNSSGVAIPALKNMPSKGKYFNGASYFYDIALDPVKSTNNGSSWVATSPSALSTITGGGAGGVGITSNTTKLVAVANDKICYSANNGKTWTDVSPTTGNSPTWYDVTWTGSQFIAIGGTYIATSTDGITWSSSNNSALAIASSYGNMTHIATSTSGVTVAVGWYTKICSTPANSLATWTARTASGATTFYWNGCYFLNGKFWIVGSNSNVYNSTDGTTWTLVSGYSTAAGTYATPTTVDYYNGTYVISGNGSLVTSTDGVTWTSRSAYGQPGYGLLSIGWCGSKWVLVNNVYAVYTTTDFTTYTQVNAKPTSMVVATAKVMIPGTVTNSVVGINTAAAVFSDVF